MRLKTLHRSFSRGLIYGWCVKPYSSFPALCCVGKPPPLGTVLAEDVCLVEGEVGSQTSFVQGTKEKGWLVVSSKTRGGSLLSSKGFLFPFSLYCEFFKKTTLPFCRVKTSKGMVWWGISLWTLTYLTKVRSSQEVLSCEACSACLALNAELTGKMFLHLQASSFAAKPNLFPSLLLSAYPVTHFILFYFISFYFILFYFNFLFCFVLLCFILFWAKLKYFRPWGFCDGFFIWGGSDKTWNATEE